MSKQVKEEMRILLRRRDFEPLLDRCQSERVYRKYLGTFLYDLEEAVFWPAIEATARLMRRWWEGGDQERVREYLRNLLWSLNQESGGIGWNAPQTIAETIALIPELAEPYGTMMLDRTLEEPLLVKNGLWGIGRMGSAIQNHLKLFGDILLEKLKDSDQQTAGTAAWAFGETGFTPALPHLEDLRYQQQSVRIYINGEFVTRPLDEWAREAIRKIKASA